MANNYLDYSASLPITTPQQRAWLEHQLEDVYVWYNEDEAQEAWVVTDNPNETNETAGKEYNAELARLFLDFPLAAHGCTPDYPPDLPTVEFLDPGTEAERLVLHTGDMQGSLESVVHLVQKFLRDCPETPAYWTLRWSETCDKPRVGEFCGGSVVVTAANQYWFSGYALGESKETELDLLGEPDVWDDHACFLSEDWKYEVANGYTRRGYWDWVKAKLEEVEYDDQNPTD